MQINTSMNIIITTNMSVAILKALPVLENWEDEDENWDIAIKSLSQSIDSSLSPPSSVSVPLPIQSKKREYKNYYSIYPYFLAGLEGTVLKEMFPSSEFPLGNLKEAIKIPNGLLQYIITVRSYVKSVFYVLKSTKHYNPVTKSHVPPKKTDRIDPMLMSSVKSEDQLKVYHLFGFQGHIGSKKGDEDIKRDELLGKLKNIMYDTTTLTILVVLLMQRLFIDIDESDIRNACIELKRRSDYENKSYNLPSRWYHDATWKKLRYVYGESFFDNLSTTLSTRLL
jgi:hypothetical protein